MSKRTCVVIALVLSVGFVFGLSLAGWTQEKHPQIHAALRALTLAERHLERAQHIYGGHRTKALELVKQARRELGEALEYARTHPPDKPATPSKSQ